MPKRIFVGVAWPYANGPLHVGHIAGAYLPADIFARYHRLRGNDVLMVSGSDCHGTPITLQAEQENVSPETLVRRYHDSFLNTFDTLGVSFDLFTQTHSTNHYQVASDFFTRLFESSYFRKESIRAPYSEGARRFLPDRYVEGTCPHCGFDRARGDQCDRCGRLQEVEALVDPKSTLDGAPIIFRSTEHFLLRLTKLEPALRTWLESSDHSHWRPNTLAFTENWLRQGLRDRPITRDIEWGVPVPVGDASFNRKRLYVWFEAVIGYLSASVEWARRNREPERWRSWWEDQESPAIQSYYFIGKDNIPFHTIIWPALLIAHGGLLLPYDVPANEFLNLEGQKMSTSQGWALTLPEIEQRFQADALRYSLVANAPETKDANWSWEDFVRRINDELVGVWGNLVNRTLGLASRTYGQVPEPGPLEHADVQLLGSGKQAFQDVGSLIEAVKIRSALHEALSLAHKANLYLAQEEPWKVLENQPKRAATVIYTALQIVCDLSLLLSPFLPQSSEQLRTILGHPVGSVGSSSQERVSDPLGDRKLLVGNYTCAPVWRSHEIPIGKELKQPQPLFTKLEERVAEREREALRGGGTE